MCTNSKSTTHLLGAVSVRCTTFTRKQRKKMKQPVKLIENAVTCMEYSIHCHTNLRSFFYFLSVRLWYRPPLSFAYTFSSFFLLLFFCCRCLLMYCLYTLFHGMGALVHSRACCPTTFVYNSNRLTMFVWCLYVIFNFFRRLFVLSAWAQSSTDFMIYRPQNMPTHWGIYFISRLFSAIVCHSCSGK